MSKKTIIYHILIIFFGILIGGISGVIYAYYYPMHELDGYWKNNYFLKTAIGSYHINTRIHIDGRKITSSSDLYDDKLNLKFSRNTIYTIIDIDHGVFSGKNEFIIEDKVENDEIIESFFKNPFSISRPTFYLLDKNTVLVDQSQGHVMFSARLWQRS